LAATLLPAPTVRAQVVNDGATKHVEQRHQHLHRRVSVGTNGSFTLLVLSDNALLTNSVNGLIGRNGHAKRKA